MQPAHSVQKIKPSYIREILQAASAPGVISLAGGLPDASRFPIELMQTAIEQIPQTPSLFQYGASQGYQPLIEQLNSLLNVADDESTLICTGSQQAIDLLARTYLNPGDTIVMEAPSYLGAIQAFQLAQANIVSVPQTATGPDLNVLESCFKNEKVKFFYAVPDFHNPTGICWSKETRRAVAELCIHFNVTLIEDIPYRELRFNGNPLPLVSDFCPKQNFQLRSFSKIAAPSFRIGALTGPKAWIKPVIKVKQGADLHSSLPMQAVLLALLQHQGFASHLDTLKEAYRNRYQALTQCLGDFLSANGVYQEVEGGMFVWLQVPGCDTDLLAQRLLAKHVAVVPSSVFYHDAQVNTEALRLNFTHAPPNQLRQAIEVLGDEVQRLL